MNAVDTIEAPRIGLGMKNEGECPICAKNPPFNAVTLAALQEARDIMSGKVKAERIPPFATKNELKEYLRKIEEEE